MINYEFLQFSVFCLSSVFVLWVVGQPDSLCKDWDWQFSLFSHMACIIRNHFAPFGFVVFLLIRSVNWEEGSTEDVHHGFVLFRGGSINTSQAALCCQCYSDPLRLCHSLSRRERESRTRREEQIFQMIKASQTCECTKWKQTRNRPVINTFTASVSAEGRLLLFLGRLPQWRVSWRVTGCRPKQIWLCWTAQEPESPAAGRWGLTAGKMWLTAVLPL